VRVVVCVTATRTETKLPASLGSATLPPPKLGESFSAQNFVSATSHLLCDGPTSANCAGPLHRTCIESMMSLRAASAMWGR
jgi:hypothetical protein